MYGREDKVELATSHRKLFITLREPQAVFIGVAAAPGLENQNVLGVSEWVHGPPDDVGVKTGAYTPSAGAPLFYLGQYICHLQFTADRDVIIAPDATVYILYYTFYRTDFKKLF